ncbi:MAG: DoxX family protein [Propionibacteriaceae bacterium]
MDTVLWIATIILAVMMAVAGLTKAVRTTDQLHASGLTYVEDFPGGFIRALGMVEVLAAVGLTLPGLLGIAPILVPITAVCVAITMVGAIVVHQRRSETKSLAMPLGLLALAIFIAIGRLGPWPL